MERSPLIPWFPVVLTNVLSGVITIVSLPPVPLTVVESPLEPSTVNVPPPACEPEPVLPVTVKEVAMVVLLMDIIRPLADT